MRQVPSDDLEGAEDAPQRVKAKRQGSGPHHALVSQYRALFEASTGSPMRSLGHPMKVMSDLLADGWTQEEISERLNLFFRNDFYKSVNFPVGAFGKNIAQMVAPKRVGPRENTLVI